MEERASRAPRCSKAGRPPRAADLLERGRRVGESARDLTDSIDELLAAGTAFVRGQADDRPYVSLAAAAGLGFVLGGGLSLRLLSELAPIVGRIVLAAVAQQALAHGDGDSRETRHS
jgi:hypothetical protein